MPTRPFTDIAAVIVANPVKNGTMVVNGRSRGCYASDTINVFMNGNYVDINPGNPDGAEGLTVTASINSLGYSYDTFTGISQETFASFNGGILVIPELEENDLDPDLTAGARSAIESFVSNGGTLITFAPDEIFNLLNNVFGFTISDNGLTEPINLTSSGLSLFPTAPSTVPDLSATDSLDTSTLPPDSVTIYEGDGENESVVTMIPYGSGKIYVIGWDWYDAAPNGEEDGGWLSFLDLILDASLTPCTNPLSYGITYNRYVKEYPTIAEIDDKYGYRFYNGIFIDGVDNGTI
jgi:hypothetical protein